MASSTKPVRSVPICSGVSLSANYLALAGPDQGPGFRFVLVNKTGREIKLAEPVPSSSHWYARSHGRWLWRASNGAGGSLLDAGNERGRVVVYAPPPGAETKILTCCRRTSPRNGSKARQEGTPSSSTSPVVSPMCARILGSGNTRWSLPTRILPAPASRQGFFPVVYGPPCSSHAAKIVSSRRW